VDTEERTLQSGELFAERYLLQKIVGEGGMGQVYLVHDTMLGDEKIALKILHPSLTRDEKHTKRFLREVQLTRKVTHPNIVRTFDVGIWNEKFYFTMEYAEGHTLKEILEEGPLDPHESVRIIIEICKGLSEIHSAEIVHRDLKAGNIIITPEGYVKITDFGVARPGTSDLTEYNEVVGSTRYMSPEAWVGREVGPYSDIYSLGVLSYYMLSGIMPFDGESAAELMFKHLETRPISLREVVAEVPEWLDVLVLKMLEKVKESRPQFGEEVILLIQDNVDRGGPLPKNISCSDSDFDDLPSFSEIQNEAAFTHVTEDYEADSISDVPWEEERETPEETPTVLSGAYLGPVRKPVEPDVQIAPLANSQHQLDRIGNMSVDCDARSSGLLTPQRPPLQEWRHLLRIPLSVVLTLAAGTLLLWPLCTGAEWAWVKLGAPKESEKVAQLLGLLPSLFVCAMLLSLPVLSFSLLFKKIETSLTNWMKAAVIMGFLIIGLFSFNCLRMGMEWNTASGEFKFLSFFVGLPVTAKYTVTNLLEIGFLSSMGSFYEVLMKGDTPLLRQTVVPSLGRSLPYYILLLGYMGALVVVLRKEVFKVQGPDALVISLPIPLLMVAGSVEYLARSWIGRFLEWNVYRVHEYSLGPFQVPLSEYAFVCGIINWVLVSVAVAIVIPKLLRRLEETGADFTES